MKTLYKIFFIIGTFSLTVSCEDMEFVIEEPKSEFFLDNVDSNSLESLVLGTYEPLTRSRGRLWESVYGTMQELMAEYSFTRETNFFGQTSIYAFDNLSDNFLGLMWTSFYEAIGRANFVISSVAGNPNLSEAEINQAIGEASFVRAICYYNLVRSWGSVPLVLEPLSDPSEAGNPLETIDIIYNQIILDLEVAEDFLPETVDASRAGRATQGAAKVMLADVFLTLGEYANAALLSKEVMDNKGRYGYDLEPSLNRLYSASSATNPEEVFALKFAQVTGQGSFLPAYAHDNRAGEANLAARGLRRFQTYENVPLIAGWDENDQRRSFNLYNTITINGAVLTANLTPTGLLDLGVSDFFYGKYIDPDATEETGAGNDFYLYRYADVLLIFAEAENQINGPTTEAYEAINQVRRRGYGVDINTPSPVADLPVGLSQQEFDDLVFRERGYEFFFECKRWFDLKRTGRLQEFAVAAGKPAPTADYWPIPSVERLNNPAIN